MANSFFHWTLGAPSPTEFDPHAELKQAKGTGFHYFFSVLARLDRMLGDGSRCRFLLTWNLDDFDPRFRDSVVILVGDERHQIPSWIGEPRVVFKTGGTSRNPIGATLSAPGPVRWRQALRDGRDLALSAGRRLAHPGRRIQRPPIYEVPLGYYALTDVPDIPFGDRPTDVFFAGSTSGSDGFTLRPRLASRKLMLDALKRTRKELPEVAIETATSSGFGAAATGGPDEYSARLMNSKISLCPRGNFDETFRLFESASCGCVAISEPLPPRWYYEDVPAIQLKDWSSLGGVLRGLLSDSAALAELAERHRRWWMERASAPAIAKFIHEHLRVARNGGAAP
jgi:hypothetical protein